MAPLQYFHIKYNNSNFYQIYFMSRPPHHLVPSDALAKRYLYEGVIVPTVLYRAESWGMRSAERRKVNILEMKCLRRLVGVS